MEKLRLSANNIKELRVGEIFVFGSNLQGMHSGGAAAIAYQKFGAEWGVGVGPTGQCYAIPTMHGSIHLIKPYVYEFIKYAEMHSELKFLVTLIGCGIAGFTPSEIGPLFKKCVNMKNVYLPFDFWREILVD